jgi:cell division protein ZapB
MNAQFDDLAAKIDQLAELAVSLRRENADLRLYIAALTSENTGFAKRMHDAHQRVAALIEKLPPSLQDTLMADPVPELTDELGEELGEDVPEPRIDAEAT